MPSSPNAPSHALTAPGSTIECPLRAASRAARFVSGADDWAKRANALATLLAPHGPSRRRSNCHEPERQAAVRVPHVAGVRPRRHRLRARRGCVADRDRRRALSRFHQRRRRQRAWPCPPASGRSGAGAGREAVARLEPVPDSGRRAARRAAVRGELRRRRVLRQFRRGGDGSRHQDGAPAASRDISRASGRRSTASIRCRLAISKRRRKPSARTPPAS